MNPVASRLAGVSAVAVLLVGPAALPSPAVAAGAGSAAKPKPVKSHVDLEALLIVDIDTGDFLFRGRLTAKAGTCVKKRTVNLTTNGVDGPVKLGSAKSDRTGTFVITVGSGPFVSSTVDATATASVKARRFGGKHPVKCSAGSDTEQYALR